MRFLLLPSLLLLAACGGLTSDPGDAGDASASDSPVGYDVVVKPDAQPPPPQDGGQCNNVALLGLDVSLQAVPQGPPPVAPGEPPPQPATVKAKMAVFRPMRNARVMSMPFLLRC